MRVLLVDDAPELLLLFRLLLERQKNIEVTTRGENFESMIDDVQWDDIDVALVDQFLGTYDGKNLLGWLAENHPRIRRILFTADHGVDKSRANADLVIFKPTDGESLYRGLFEGKNE